MTSQLTSLSQRRTKFALPAAVLALTAAVPTLAQHGPINDSSPVSGVINSPWCVIGQAGGTEGASGPLPIANTFIEMEPNDAPADAQPVSLNVGERITVTGSIESSLDRDTFQLHFEAGDVIQLFVENPSSAPALVAQVTLSDLAGVPIVSAASTLSTTVYPPTAPFVLPTGADGETALAWIIKDAGDVLITVENINASIADYILDVTRVRPALEQAPAGATQIVFLDYDGAQITQGDIFNPLPGPDPISPMVATLPNWGLDASDENAVIDAITAQITMNIEALQSINPSFAYEVRNSRDDADPFGEPFVTRLIIGGTQAELGVNTIGIAQSLDVGNFAPNETAFILLDLMSDQSSSASINLIPLEPGFTIIQAIGQAVGNIASHELGHTLGNFHTEPTNAVRSLMDRGSGDIPGTIYGIGPDDIFGSADDEIVQFAPDDYSDAESVAFGVEPTDLITAYAFSSPNGCPVDLNGDGVVDGADLATLLVGWGAPGPADFNNDGVVDGTDLARLLVGWGPCS